MKIGFDNDKYLKTQSEHIRSRINAFGGKLYLEFGGKIFDDYHASRVLPGFQPDSKIKMLLNMADEAEVVIVINADDIVKNKVRGDLGITYDADVLRLIDAFREAGLYVGSVVITQYAGQTAADIFRKRLESLGMKAYLHYPIEGYPNNVPLIISEDGFGKNEYVETTRPLVIVTAPGPGSGKMATCLSQLYHEHKRNINAGYAKFETFPVWNLPLKHPVNLAYEAATADLNDVNMIDPFHLDAYGTKAVNYNRDVEVFPVLNSIFEKISGKSPYNSPTDMGVNMAGLCIIDDEVCAEASRQEIIRRYFNTLCDEKMGKISSEAVYKIELLMAKAGIEANDRLVAVKAREVAELTEKIAKGSMYGLPDLALKVSLGYGGSHFPLFQEGWKDSDDWGLNVTVAFSTTLWDGGKVLNSINRSKSQAESARLDLENAKDQLVVQLNQSLRSSSYALADIGYLEANARLLESQLSLLQMELDAGYGSKADVLRKKIDILENDVELQQRKAELMQNALEIRYLSGM